jgi:hypothetical protein
MHVRNLLAAAAFCVSASAASSATLLADGTLNSAGDLTRIEDGGVILEFLDWSVTRGMSVTSALASYSGAGFAVANETQMSALFDAFGMIYAFSAGESVNLTASGNVTDAEATAFTATVGTTSQNASLATYVDATANSPFVYLCVSLGTCIPSSFSRDADLSTGNQFLGIALVRTAPVEVIPLPAALPLLLAGLGGLGLMARRKRNS